MRRDRVPQAKTPSQSAGGVQISTLRMGEALSSHFKQLCQLQLVESQLWQNMAEFAIEQVDARRSIARSGESEGLTTYPYIGKRVVLTEELTLRHNGVTIPKGTEGVVARNVGYLLAVDFGDLPGLDVGGCEVSVDPKQLVGLGES